MERWDLVCNLYSHLVCEHTGVSNSSCHRWNHWAQELSLLFQMTDSTVEELKSDRCCEHSVSVRRLKEVTGQTLIPTRHSLSCLVLLFLLFIQGFLMRFCLRKLNEFKCKHLSNQLIRLKEESLFPVTLVPPFVNIINDDSIKKQNRQIALGS